MPHPSLPIPHFQSAETNGQWPPNCESRNRNNRRDVPFIDILDDDSLLNIICLYRLAVLDEDEHGDRRILVGGEWFHERWWYRLAQVCRRWRNLVFASASYLGLCLVCSHGTPVKAMLAYSPPLPLIMDYISRGRDLTMRVKEGISIGLRQRERIRRIRFYGPASSLQKFVAAMDKEFPKLEYLFIEPEAKDNTLVLPPTFRAPHLRHLVLINVFLPFGSPLLTTTTVGLVTLWLEKIPSSTQLSPGDLLTQLLLMPQLETFGIEFQSTAPDGDNMLRSSIMVPATLPNLRWFMFRGVSTYLEALLPSMTTPLLERFTIFFPAQSTFSTPSLLQFMSTTENLRFPVAKFVFSEQGVTVVMFPHKGAKNYSFFMSVRCNLPATQVSSMAQICNILSPVFSSVVDLTLTCIVWDLKFHFPDYVDWRRLLGAFNGVRTLHMISVLISSVSRYLQFDDGEPTRTPELLPELKELSYSSITDASDPFAPFINARRDSGRPVTLIRRPVLLDGKS